MFAFKATEKDMTCLDFQYELGKLYEIKGKLKLCSNGFHFCKKLKDIHDYYPFHDKNNRYFLVEIPDDAKVITEADADGDISVTNKIKFIRELVEQDWIDSGIIRQMKDNSLYVKYPNGFESWSEYDDQGKLIHFKTSDGLEKWWKYDDQGNEIHYKSSTGFEKWWEYNEQGKIIHFKNSHRYEEWYEYDDNGNLIHHKNSSGYKQWWEYNEKGKAVYRNNSKAFK